MADHTPLVSVCIPVYNCEKYIADTLNCLCRQTYKNIEIITVDDGSTDKTGLMINSINDERITLIPGSNGGASKARNTAYAQTKGEYIIFFDADDLAEPDFILKQVNKIHENKHAVVLSAWGRFYNNDITTFKPDHIPDHDMTFPDWIKYYWYKGNPMTNPGRIIIPRKLIDEAGIWNEELGLNDDLEFFTRVFLKAEKIVFNPDAVFYYRSGINGLSSEKSNAGYLSLYNSIFLSIKHVLSSYDHEPMLLKSCANMWQSFIYIAYPYQKKYIHLAENEIGMLINPDYKFQSSGITKCLTYCIGWKTTKKIKILINKLF